MNRQSGPDRDRLLFHYTSVKALDNRTIMAAPAGKGIWLAPPEGEWLSCMEGLPEDVHINRIQTGATRIFACTDKGLFEWKGTRWAAMDIPFACYQVREVGDVLFAATELGVWCQTEDGWKSTACPRLPVYDILYTPQYIFLGLNGGIAMYDRMTCTWQQFPMGTAITGLGAFRSRLLGITEKGILVQGDGKGGFDKVSLPGLFVFRVVAVGGSVYLCTERGLYRMDELRGQTCFISVCMGEPVTDLDACGDQMYLATLNSGVQTIQR